MNRIRFREGYQNIHRFVDPNMIYTLIISSLYINSLSFYTCEHFVDSPANTIHRAIAGSMLVHRLRRWPNIEPTMTQCLVFAGIVRWRLCFSLISSTCMLGRVIFLFHLAPGAG